MSIRAALAEGRIIDPLDKHVIQPSSVDLAVDRSFRVFRNDITPYIDPKEPPENLTELVEVVDDGAFILHPGDFVRGSTSSGSRFATTSSRGWRGRVRSAGSGC